MTLSLLERDDGKYVIQDDENLDEWMVFGPDMVMQDTEFAARRHTTVDDWKPGNDRTSESGQTDVDDWKLK